MTPSNALQGAVILSVFLLPILTYLYFTRRPAHGAAGPLPPPTEITALYIHPIKSCHGIQVQSARLLPTGLDLDRQWMWTSHPSHEFLTIRQNARMTLIRPTYNVSTDTLTITAPAPNAIDEKLEFSIPAHPTSEWLAAHTTLAKVKIWSVWTSAHMYDPTLTEAFNAFFGREVRLVYKPPFSNEPRGLGSNGAPEILGRVGKTCFPDMMPVLVGSESSIRELNGRIARADAAGTPRVKIGITRFRPNIVVEGQRDVPWDEDRWKTLRISLPTNSVTKAHPITLDVTQRCARCHVPNVDPETAEQHKKQPWDTLMKYRRVDEGIKYKPCFGMLCVPMERREGEVVEVKVGMTVEVTRVTGRHKYIAGF